jgi:tetratricopeptide (TPR) repeat protein
LLSGLATSYLGQKKITDAEYFAREALMLSINRYGVYSIRTSSSLLTLIRIISEQGRQAEAVLLANAALKITQEISDFPGSPFLAEVRRAMATALVADGKYTEAQVVFAEMLQGVQSDPEIAKKYQTGDLDWSLAMIKTGKSDQAIQMTKQMLDVASTKLDN